MSLYSFRVTGRAADVTTFANLLLATTKDGRVDLSLVARLGPAFVIPGAFQPAQTTVESNARVKQVTVRSSADKHDGVMLVLPDVHDWSSEPEFRDVNDELGFFWFGSCDEDLVPTFEHISECFPQLTFLTCSQFVPQLVPGPGMVGFRDGGITFL